MDKKIEEEDSVFGSFGYKAQGEKCPW